MKFPWSHTTIVDMIKNDHKLEEKCNHVTADIAAGKLDMAKFVEELGPALTHTEADVRAKGTTLLSHVLHDLPSDSLNAEQVKLLCVFYGDRTLDHNIVTPAVLDGVEALSRMTNFPSTCAVPLLQSLFKRIPCQSQKKAERTLYFRTITQVSERCQVELKEWGSDFLYGVIGAIESERDPRNLLYLFEHMPTFIRAFPMYHLAEEMFETFACYFPIDFHPNPNDPNDITRSMLAERLADCLCATSELAVFAVPLLLEKMESSLLVAKLDSLALLVRCLSLLEVRQVAEHYGELWNALKLELLLPGVKEADKELLDAGLTAVRELSRHASADEPSAKLLLDQILVSLMASLTDASSKQFETSLRVVLSCASASEFCALYVADKLLPMLLAQLNPDSYIEIRIENRLIDSLQRIMAACAKWCCVGKLDPSLVGQVQKLFVQILQQTGSDGSEQTRSALRAVSCAPEMISSENRYVVYSKLVLLMLVPDSPQADAVEECLSSLAIRYSEEVKTLVLSKLMSHDFATAEQALVRRIFKSFGKLIVCHGYTYKMVDFLMAKIFAQPVDERLAIVAMDTLTDAVELGGWNELAKGELYVQYKLIDRFVEYANDDLGSEYLHSMAHLMTAVVKRLPVEEQKELILKRLPPLKLQQRADLYLASGLLGYLDESVPLVDHFENLVTDLTQLALTTDDERVRGVCHRLLCSLFNRMPDDEHHRGVLKRLLTLLRGELKKHNHQAVLVLSWIGKGLISRGHAEAGEIVDDIAELLDHPTLGHVATLAFEILTVEFPQLHLALVRNLFKQKLFVWVMKKLEAKIEQYAGTHLKALAFVFKATPHVVLRMNLAKVGPVLLRCLAQDDDRTVVEAMTIVLRFTREQDPFVKDHLQTLIPALLKLIVRQSSMNVRIEALECLLCICQYPTFLLLPFKVNVLSELQKPLDDRKRLVRNAAVAARLQWFMVGSEQPKPDK
ncbi:MMS19 nucleotide excision repair protein [Anopheles cruzii]|uniref:MMS19 nucleotide excision repair protein n=1 Tax=Anopheles cruzii TaxID=68878 RepID=UPI0022EC8241|nr:MMS19 nucleotide excision repair protein [Anopheles cruzii]